MPFKINPLHAVDSYKLGHRSQYPENTAVVYSNMTARSDARFAAPAGYHDGKIVFFGLQGAWKDIVEIWDEGFFNLAKDDAVRSYINRIGPFIGGSEITTEHLEDLHDLGYLPIRLKALPEGSRVNMRVPLLTITNTHDDFAWLVNYLETWISNETWKPMTVATIAYTFRKILEDFAEQTGAPKEFVMWQGHDFSCRGMSGMMDSAKSGAGHLTSFFGTDTLLAVDYLEGAYKGKETFVGGSVPATEHSVMTMGGPDGELALVKRIITKVNPTGIVSLVADSYNFWDMITNGAAALKDDILARKPDTFIGAKVVFRPDSGDPVDIICGTAYEVESLEEGSALMKTLGDFRDPGRTIRLPTGKYYLETKGDDLVWRWTEITPTPERKGAVECLWDTFGGTTTEKGFKTLDSHVGLIYGDSITLDRAVQILTRLQDKGFSSANIVFGIGSYTYNCLTRDIFGLAMKATYGVVDGVGREIYKDPKTGDGVKKSAKGLLMVEKIGDDFVLTDQVTPQQEATGCLELVWENNVRYREHSVAEIRARLWPAT